MKDLASLRARLSGAALLIVATFAIGVVGYRIIGGPSHTWMDAVYMAANALTTTGFREAIDISSNAPGQAFTVILMIFGAGVLVYSTSVITAFVVEGDLTEQFRRSRMRAAVDRMSGHYIVCGAGATGEAVARELVNTERKVVVIDQDKNRLARITEIMPTVPVFMDDFTDDQVLLQAGIARAVGIVICTIVDKDLLVTCVTARQLNPKIRIVARSANERSTARLKQAGADTVVSPALIGGMRMASELVRPSVVSFLDMMLRDTNRNLRVEEVMVPNGSRFVGRTLGDLNTHSRTNCLLLATRSPDGNYAYNPPDDAQMSAGTILIVMGDPKDVRQLSEMCESGAPASRDSITAARV